jgi:signal transduction histidine kinase
VLTTAQEVQTLRLDDARRNLPVHIRGVVTSKGRPYDYWLSIQDETRGIFVDIHAISNAVPVCGESWDIIGHAGAGDFAPVVIADSGTRLGIGRMPEPAHPAWGELINGSMDVQWVEFQGLVTDVQTNMLSLLLAGGTLDVGMEGHFESDLQPFKKSVVRIRGVLYAAWSSTREVHVGNIVMRNATVNVDIPAPADPFDAIVKTPRELLLFDAQATAFRRVKVRGQVIHAEPGRVILTANGTGLRVLPAGKADVHVGDMAEAVGYPEISDTSLLLREAIIRKTGEEMLRPAKILSEDNLTQEGADSTRVHVTGTLLGSHFEYGSHVLEMRSGQQLYLARLAPNPQNDLSLRTGSQLGLEGVYLAQKQTRPGVEAESFELLLNSPRDITVLSQPSWWTLQRLLVVVGLLLVVLMISVGWITQLRRLVEQRTAQLHQEIRERERVERARALEAERSRIARDLHDDLGSSLTEIGVLASAGQRSPADGNNYPTLFRNIAGKARSLIAALDVIVWAVDPEDNSLQSVADYLSGFAGEYLSASGAACRFKIPVSFPDLTLNGRVRHGLLMAVKETLNNIVRHSDATEVVFSMGVAGDDLEIVIADNGKGFDPALVRDGHGLKNLPARLEKIGGKCSVESHVGGGTIVAIRFPLSTSNETHMPQGEA